MRITYSLTLPRDVTTVPVVRRLCKGALLELGVMPQDIHDVALAVTEACANVVEHSSDVDDEYEVFVSVSDGLCEIRVIDAGRGFDAAGLERSNQPENLSAERGRGITLMRALVDNASFESAPEEGTIVHLHKQLNLEDDSLFLQVTSGDGKQRS